MVFGGKRKHTCIGAYRPTGFRSVPREESILTKKSTEHETKTAWSLSITTLVDTPAGN